MTDHFLHKSRKPWKQLKKETCKKEPPVRLGKAATELKHLSLCNHESIVRRKLSLPCFYSADEMHAVVLKNWLKLPKARKRLTEASLWF